MSEPVERVVQVGAGATLVRLSGVLGNETRADALFSDLSGIVAVDLDGVRRITSYGVREWIRAVSAFPRGQLYLTRLRPAMVAQLNTISGFAGNAEVLSLYLPYTCDECGHEHDVLLDATTERHLLSRDVPARPCPQCGKSAEFDDDPEAYFSWVSSQPEPSPPAAVRALFEGGATKGARLKVQKEVGDDLTALWLSGPLNERARFKRTVDGVDGSLVLVCAGISDANEAGLAQLRQVLENPDNTTYVARVPLAVAEKIGRTLEGRLLSLVLPGECETCNGTDVVVDARTLWGEAPSTCAACGAPAHLLDTTNASRFPLVRKPKNIADYLGARPGSYLTGLDDGEASTRTPHPSEAGTPMSRYRVIGRIGVGGMAEVLLAEQKGPAGFNKLVVLKRILAEFANRPDFVEMFLNEARTAAFINHPNVVQIYDLGRDGPHYFIAMEYVRGSDLRAIIKLARSLDVKIPVNVAARIAADICAGLHGAHTAVDPDGRRLEIVHRDMSPTNVLLSNDGVVKIVDFGIAKTRAHKEHTEPGTLKGKVIYMAPEQIDSTLGEVDARSDVFAVGLVLHQLLTGRAAFHRSSDAESLVAVLVARLPDTRETRPEVPAALQRIIEKATARPQSDRYQTAEEMHLALEQLLSGGKQVTTAAHVGHWVAWLKGRGELEAKPVDLTLDVEDLSAAETKLLMTPTPPRKEREE